MIYTLFLVYITYTFYIPLAQFLYPIQLFTLMIVYIYILKKGANIKKLKNSKNKCLNIVYIYILKKGNTIKKLKNSKNKCLDIVYIYPEKRDQSKNSKTNRCSIRLQYPEIIRQSKSDNNSALSDVEIKKNNNFRFSIQCIHEIN